MADADHGDPIEEHVEQWRRAERRRPGAEAAEIVKLALRLRQEVAGLMSVGLAVDEAFLVALKRIGQLDPSSGRITREGSFGVWKQSVAASSDSGEQSAVARTEGRVAFGWAALAAVAIKVPMLFGVSMEDRGDFYVRNASLFVLPCLIGFFAWKRRLGASTIAWIIGAFSIAGLVANLPAFSASRDFAALVDLHLPIALWVIVGVAYAGGRWNEVGGRMDFIRFSGELFIYYVLIALGGGVLTAFMALTFQSIGVNIEAFIPWVLPCGAAGAVVIGSWLVEAKQGVIENMAPVLTRLFTPLFAAMLVTFLGTLLWSERGITMGREMLIGFDLLLVLVLGLLVYSISARDPLAPPGAFDVVQVVLLFGALVADVVALWAVGARIDEFGFSSNRVAALGENVILLVNLGWSAVLYVKFLFGRGVFSGLERWQTRYVPVYAIWAASVVIVFPPLFRWLR